MLTRPSLFPRTQIISFTQVRKTGQQQNLTAKTWFARAIINPTHFRDRAIDPKESEVYKFYFLHKKNAFFSAVVVAVFGNRNSSHFPSNKTHYYFKTSQESTKIFAIFIQLWRRVDSTSSGGENRICEFMTRWMISLVFHSISSLAGLCHGTTNSRDMYSLKQNLNILNWHVNISGKNR